eukprot:gene1348-1365_t
MAALPTAGDPRFFVQGGAQALKDIAAAAGAECPPDMADRMFRGVAPLQTAGEEQISFLDNRKYISALAASRAGAVIVHPEMTGHVPAGCAALVTREPYIGWARVSALFHPPPPQTPGVHPTAIVHETARIDPSAEIGAYTVVALRQMVAERAAARAAKVNIPADVAMDLTEPNNEDGTGTAVTIPVIDIARIMHALVAELLAFIDTPSRRGLIRAAAIEDADDDAN